MNHLRRDLAPISERAWEQIDSEAKRSLHNFLAAAAWSTSTAPWVGRTTCVATGRTNELSGLGDGVLAGARRARPLVELQVPFTLSRLELDAVDRGAGDVDLDPVIDAARTIALAEDQLVFDGNDSVMITGLVDGSPHDAVPIGDDYGDFPGLVARAVTTLRTAGVDGPYGVALGTQCYTGVIETTEKGGYPVLEHLRLIAGGPVIWAPAINGSAVVSLRGGDYTITVRRGSVDRVPGPRRRIGDAVLRGEPDVLERLARGGRRPAVSLTGPLEPDSGRRARFLGTVTNRRGT